MSGHDCRVLDIQVDDAKPLFDAEVGANNLGSSGTNALELTLTKRWKHATNQEEGIPV